MLRANDRSQASLSDRRIWLRFLLLLLVGLLFAGVIGFALAAPVPIRIGSYLLVGPRVRPYELPDGLYIAKSSQSASVVESVSVRNVSPVRPGETWVRWWRWKDIGCWRLE
jgi:hypothetical protein